MEKRLHTDRKSCHMDLYTVEHSDQTGGLDMDRTPNWRVFCFFDELRKGLVESLCSSVSFSEVDEMNLS